MANAIYPSFDTSLLLGTNLVTSNVSCMLVSTTSGSGSNNYSYSSTNTVIANVETGSVVAASVALTSKSAANGNFYCGNVVFANVTTPASGGNGQALVFYINTGNTATGNLICYIDSFSPVIPNGGNVTVGFNTGILLNIS